MPETVCTWARCEAGLPPPDLASEKQANGAAILLPSDTDPLPCLYTPCLERSVCWHISRVLGLTTSSLRSMPFPSKRSTLRPQHLGFKEITKSLGLCFLLPAKRHCGVAVAKAAHHVPLPFPRPPEQGGRPRLPKQRSCLSALLSRALPSPGPSAVVSAGRAFSRSFSSFSACRSSSNAQGALMPASAAFFFAISIPLEVASAAMTGVRTMAAVLVQQSHTRHVLNGNSLS